MIEFMHWLQSFSTPTLDAIFLLITNLVNEAVFLCIAVWIFWCVDKKKGLKIVSVFAFGFSLNYALKSLFQIPRPFQRSELIRAIDTQTSYGYSFPSAHAQTTSGFFTVLYRCFPRPGVLWTGIIFTVLVAASRVYLGVHTPVDVGVGILVGIVSMWALDVAFELIFSRKKESWLLLCVPAAIVAMAIWPDEDVLQILAVFIGFIIGYVVDDRWIHLKADLTFRRKVIRFMTGITGVLIFAVILQQALHAGLIYGMIVEAVIGLWISAGAPMIFKKFGV